MYEHHTERLLTRAEFAWRVARHVAYGTAAVAISLTIGILGYHFFAQLSWVDSLLNASMILGGMGPVDPLSTNSAKVFASMYALFSGLVFIGTVGLLLAPFFHRVLHNLHVKDDDNDTADS